MRTANFTGFCNRVGFIIKIGKKSKFSRSVGNEFRLLRALRSSSVGACAKREFKFELHTWKMVPLCQIQEWGNLVHGSNPWERDLRIAFASVPLHVSNTCYRLRTVSYTGWRPLLSSPPLLFPPQTCFPSGFISPGCASVNVPTIITIEI